MTTAIAIPKRKPGIDAREAAKAAAEYFRELYPNVIAFSLEEVEMSQDGLFWSITLSFEIPSKPNNPMHMFQPPKTKFKVFKVDAKTGKVVAMKIRRLE